MGNRVARLATPCFAAAGDGERGHHHAGDDVHTNGAGDDNCNSVMHILSFRSGGESPAKGIGAIHAAFLPSNPVTSGGSLLNADQMSLSGSSSFDSSNSFSFRTLQQSQYSGPLDSPSTSATTSGMSVSRHGRPRSDQQILDDLLATRQRRQCQAAASSKSPILGGLRRAVASVLRGTPCVSPGRGRDVVIHDAGEQFPAPPAAATNGIGGSAAINGPSSGQDAAAEEGRVQWARGKAGEDRVHIVFSKENGWSFVGIYDGFNGPDATDYLAAHLYDAVCRELLDAGVIVDDDEEPPQQGKHDEVLAALARALHATETGYFAEAEARAGECPELAMMGSCVLVVLVKGADVYVMNVGDSRAVLARQAEPDLSRAIAAGVNTEEIVRQFDACDMGDLGALQLTMDHSTSVYKEVRRIQSEHLDDPACIVHNRVKGSLKVTRAFGAGYLKEPRWNKALLEVFRVDYVGTSPYISCRPHLRHHQLGSRDKFMILSSDGLYEYFTNEEVVLQVEAFTASYPGEDPAKYLSHEILCRAANRAGMEIHELLEIQQGDRRRYHDDVSIIIISLDLEGKIWRS